MSDTRLTVPERNDLKRYEQVIQDGMATFMKVGEALLQIRNGTLYREHYKTFEAYCEDRFDLGKSHAYRLIEAYETKKRVDDLSPIGDKLKTESQYREIAKVPEEQVQAVLDKVVEDSKETGKPITAKAIKDAAAELATEYEDVEPPAPKKPDWKNHRVLAIKHLESAMRSADDLNEIHKYRRHDEVLLMIKDAIQFLKDVK